MTTARRVVGSIAVAAALIAGSTVLATAPAAAKGEPAAAPAQAQLASWDSNVYLYYSGSSNSSWSKYGTGVNDFAGHTFAADGEGHGQNVKNNVYRAWNNDQNFRARIFYNENQNASGDAPYDDVWPGESRALNSGVQNNNASLGWYYAG
ncbi:hypothetical protein [Streptomyces phaeochromogenes]|uniref:hypothetical protein n=1 Tax=Streptomyces phaeochromogenes TaxID=1923 RepID=UPI0033EC3DCF|nr:hypothetical protein OG478_03085 [Streptomyces phaeochromogenes]WSW20368.1 hypothetical protein OG277_49395 [Streptomyces phaeochromogenes]WTA01665.1 hypothetical protein OHB08_04750 [Streptomyces phaeochromogenes]